MAAQMCAAGWSGVEVGASLHDSGISSAVVAYMLGARIIECHFTLNRTMKGSDHAWSLEPDGMKRLFRDLHHEFFQFGFRFLSGVPNLPRLARVRNFGRGNSGA